MDADGDASAEKMNEKEDKEFEKQLGLQCAWVGGSPGGGGAVGARSDSDMDGEEGAAADRDHRSHLAAGGAKKPASSASASG